MDRDLPEKQWEDVLKAKTVKALQEARAVPDAEAKRGRDLILDVVMHGNYCSFSLFALTLLPADVPEFWRKIRISGNTTLNAVSYQLL